MDLNYCISYLKTAVSLSCTAVINFRNKDTLVVLIEGIARMSSQTSLNVHSKFLAFESVNSQLLQSFGRRIVLDGQD